MMRHQYLFTTKLFFFSRLLCGTLVSCGWTVRRDRVSLLTQKKLFPLLSEQLRGQRFKNSEYDTSVCNLMDHGGVVQADLEHLMTHLNFPPPQTFSHFLIYYENFPLILKSPITESQHCLALTVCFSGCYCASFLTSFSCLWLSSHGCMVRQHFSFLFTNPLKPMTHKCFQCLFVFFCVILTVLSATLNILISTALITVTSPWLTHQK